MKKKLLKSLKIILLLLSVLVLFVVIGLIWPLPNIAPPQKHDGLLIKSIWVIDVKTGTVLGPRNVLIKGGVIAAIDSSEILVNDPNTLLIDGSGKYIIPGLWDMHTHSNQQSEWLHHPLYIANGVTGVRDMSGQLNEKDSYWVGSRERLIWNDELNDNKRVTPRYVLQSSYQMDGAASVPDGYPEYFKLLKPEDTDSLLRFYQKEKVDFIKVYQQIVPESYRQLALKAREYDIYLAGHKPMFVPLKEAVMLGQKSFEHGRVFLFEAFPNADSLRTSKDWKGYFSVSKKSMIKDFDSEVAIELMELMRDYDAHWVPTLQTLKFEANAHRPSFQENPNLKYVSMVRKKLWWDFDLKNNTRRNQAMGIAKLSTHFYEASKAQVRLANDVGVPIMAGTDVTDSYVFAGFSLHDELEDLTKSGLSNLEALQSATIVPARFAEKDGKYGSVEIGKAADLVILNDNPLKNITNSRKIDGVIINGLYYDSGKINELKQFTESMAASYHLNIKVFFGLLNSPLIRVQFKD
ncbi:amidohydrolase family protein [Flagellimonas sp. S174]|uniref:amidohydrolase family protein n=1 Tax=Flagellimonas sp. S174 TaxID=3410790 RepID=UPI003BF4774C